MAHEIRRFAKNDGIRFDSGSRRVAAPAAHHVEVLGLELRHERGDVGRVVLQVAVGGHHDVAARAVEAGREGGRLPEVPAQQHDLHPRVARLQLQQALARPVAAAVVHQHDLERAAERAERGAQLLVQVGQVLLLVVERHHDGDVHARGVVHGEPEYTRRPRSAGQRPAATQVRPVQGIAATAATRSTTPVRGATSTPNARRRGSSARSAAAHATSGERRGRRERVHRESARHVEREQPAEGACRAARGTRQAREHLHVAQRDRQPVEVQQPDGQRRQSPDRPEDQAERRARARHEPQRRRRFEAGSGGLAHDSCPARPAIALANVTASPRQQQHSARMGSSTAASAWPEPIWCAWASPIT